MQISITPLTIVLAIATGALGAYLAYRRGRNPYVWFFIGCFFGILGAFAIFFAPASRKKIATKSMPATERSSTIQGPSDKYWYYLNPDQSQAGPMSLDALITTWKEGKISLTTYVWHEELPEWKLLQDLITS